MRASSIPLVAPNKIDDPIQAKWYKIRDMCFARNNALLNIPLAIKMAAVCDHPDAQWLIEACAGKDVNTKADAKEVFSAFDENDARALCFKWLVGYIRDQKKDLFLLRRSAELGFAFAQALFAEWTESEERFNLAQSAATQGERRGFLLLGACFESGVGCEKDLNKAEENYLRASKLGEVAAMTCLGDLYNDLDPRRWQWWGHAAAGHSVWEFMNFFEKHVESFNSGTGSASLMVAIGQALQGHVDEQASTIFGLQCPSNGRSFCLARQAVAFYEDRVKEN